MRSKSPWIANYHTATGMREAAAPERLAQPLLEQAPAGARAEQQGRDNWQRMWRAFFARLTSKL